MALSEGKILAIQIDYELGKLSKTSICKKHRISRPTLRKHASENNWLYQKSFQEVSKEVEKRTIAKLVEENADIVTEATEKFLKDSSYIREFVMKNIKKLQEDIEGANWDFESVNSNAFMNFQKIGEIATRTIVSLYSTERKALGLDREDDIEKARKIKQADKQENQDPTEGETPESIDAKLKELENK